MSKVNHNGLLSGHIGNLVHRELKGQQVVQAMPSHYRDANSEAQQKQRSGMRNILAFYRILKHVIKGQFEESSALRRDYNYFVHHNLLLKSVELSKEDYNKGLCILAPYVISSGTLPSLATSVVDNRLRFTMNADEWKSNDILRLIKVEESAFTNNGSTILKAIYLDTNILTPINQVIESDTLIHGTYAYVHIRNTRKGRLVSSQQLILI